MIQKPTNFTIIKNYFDIYLDFQNKRGHRPEFAHGNNDVNLNSPLKLFYLTKKN